MKVVNIYCADGEDVEPVTINIVDNVSKKQGCGVKSNDLKEFFCSEGKVLADYLFKSPPGGTMDAFIQELLHRRAAMFKVLL